MKLFELLNSMTTEEKKYVKKYFNAQSESLHELYLEIYLLDEEKYKSKKIAIYRKLYKKGWTEASEKFLWNQITNLYEALRSFIAQYWIDKNQEILELNKSINFLHTILNRNQIDLYEKEWNYYSNLFESKQYYYGLAELCLLQYNHLCRNPKTITQSISFLKKAYEYKLMASWEDTTSIQYTALTTNYSKEIYGLETTFTIEDFINLRNELFKSFFNPLKSANSLLVAQESTEKWTYVLEIIDMLKDKELQIKEPVKFKLCQCIFNYALILLYNDDLEKPNVIFEFILNENLILNTVSNSTVFYFNYSTLLLKKGETEKAQFMQAEVMLNLEGIHESKQTLFKIRNIYLNILNGELKNVYYDINEITPKLYKEDQQIYVRALLVMYHIESRDIESAVRECENAKKTTGIKAEIAFEESMIIDYIHSILLCLNKENYNLTKFKKIEKSILTNPLWINSNHLLKNWIIKFIAKINQRKIYI